MARIEYRGDVQKKLGKDGDVIYSQRRGGSFHSKKVAKKISNPRSPAQRAFWELTAFLDDMWNTLTPEERRSWDGAHPYNQRRRQPSELGALELIQISAGIKSGHNNFIEANMLAFSVGRTTILRRPLNIMPAPRRLQNLQACFDGAKLIVTWDDLPPIKKLPPKTEYGETEHFARIWIYSDQRNFHTQYAGYAPAAARSFEITKARGKGGKVKKLSACRGDMISIQADSVDRSTGWASNPTETIQIQLPTARVRRLKPRN